jgi:hypothetical protein
MHSLAVAVAKLKFCNSLKQQIKSKKAPAAKSEVFINV